jgi:hypothetical protein
MMSQFTVFKSGLVWGELVVQPVASCYNSYGNMADLLMQKYMCKSWSDDGIVNNCC